jgi:hypothetical protein
MRSGGVRRGREGGRKRDDEGKDGWGRGDKRDLLDFVIGAIDIVICFPKGRNHVLLGVTGGSGSGWVLNDDGGVMLGYDRKNLSARDIAPIHGVWRLSARSGLVGTSALINIYASSFRVPNATLREKVPVDVELPDTRSVADDGRHDVG